MKVSNNSLEQPFVMEIRKRVMLVESSVTSPPDPGSVTQAIERVNPPIKIWLQSLYQNITWKWCSDKLIMVPVWFTGSQLPPTVMKQSHKLKVTKRMSF